MKRITVGEPDYVLSMNSAGSDQQWRSLADVIDSVGGVGDADTVDGKHAAAFELVVNKGAAGGYASLNASTLVVEDPANAVSVPAASKIVKSEGGGTIALGWLPATLTGKDADTLDGIHAAGFSTGPHLWALDGANYIVPSASHPVGPITHQVEQLGQSGREWGKLWSKDAFFSGKIGIGEESPTRLFEVHCNGDAGIALYRYEATAAGPSLLQNHSRGTKAAPASSQAGDGCGSQTFCGYEDGVGFSNAAIIRCNLDAAPSGGMPGRLTFLTTPAGSTTATEALRIDSAQNIRAMTASAGNNAVGVWAFKNTGTAPTTWPANVAQMWCEDNVAGEACIKFATEHGDIIKLYQQAHLADVKANYVAGELDTENKIIAALNATNAKINSILAGEENNGLRASA